MHRAGQACLLARRLVEAGVPLTTVFFNPSIRGQDKDPGDTDAYGWDTHNDIFDALRDHLLPRFDRTFSVLLEDLRQRGLLDSTLVVCMGEFGRAPLVALERNFAGASPGRKHWAAVYSIVLAGAGVPRRQGARRLGSAGGLSRDAGVQPGRRRRHDLRGPRHRSGGALPRRAGPSLSHRRGKADSRTVSGAVKTAPQAQRASEGFLLPRLARSALGSPASSRASSSTFRPSPSPREAVMWFLTRPGEDKILAFRLEQARLPFSYAEVGATAKGPPAGCDVDHNRVQLGAGQSVFDAACAALRRWQQFPSPWTEIQPATTPLQAGYTVTLLARTFGLWWLNACRIVYAIDEASPVRRFGVAYGTLPGHVESGEEHFSVEWCGDDSVWYDILAFSRPRHPLVRLAYPLARRMQRRFVRESQAAMRRLATEGRLHPL